MWCVQIWWVITKLNYSRTSAGRDNGWEEETWEQVPPHHLLQLIDQVWHVPLVFFHHMWKISQNVFFKKKGKKKQEEHLHDAWLRLTLSLDSGIFVGAFTACLQMFLSCKAAERKVWCHDWGFILPPSHLSSAVTIVLTSWWMTPASALWLVVWTASSCSFSFPHKGTEVDFVID